MISGEIGDDADYGFCAVIPIELNADGFAGVGEAEGMGVGFVYDKGVCGIALGEV